MTAAKQAQPSRKDRKPEAPAKRNTRAVARRLFPDWPRSQRARWVLSRLRVDAGTWRWPIGTEHAEIEVPRFLRTLPPGPALEIVETLRDKRVRGIRLITGLVAGRKW